MSYSNNTDGTIRTIGNDDRDPYWYPGKLYQMYPQNHHSTQSSSVSACTTPAYNSTPINYSSSGGTYGGNTSDFSTDTGWGGVVWICLGLLIGLAFVIYLVHENQTSNSFTYNYTYSASYQNTAVARVGCNVRARPNRRGRRIGSVRKGTTVQILTPGKWDYVQLPNGRMGYIFDRLLTKN